MDVLFPMPKSDAGIDYHIYYLIRIEMAIEMAIYRRMNDGHAIPYNILFSNLLKANGHRELVQNLFTGLIKLKAKEYYYD